MIMSAIIIASSILTRSIQTTVLSLKNYNIALGFKKIFLATLIAILILVLLVLFIRILWLIWFAL